MLPQLNSKVLPNPSAGPRERSSAVPSRSCVGVLTGHPGQVTGEALGCCWGLPGGADQSRQEAWSPPHVGLVPESCPPTHWCLGLSWGGLPALGVASSVPICCACSWPLLSVGLTLPRPSCRTCTGTSLVTGPTTAQHLRTPRPTATRSPRDPAREQVTAQTGLLPGASPSHHCLPLPCLMAVWPAAAVTQCQGRCWTWKNRTS